MNTLISTLVIVTFSAFTACIPSCSRAQVPVAPVTSPILTWNQTALDTIERIKPTQHRAIRLLAYMSLAQYAALADMQDKTAMPDAVTTASARVLSDLAPARAGFVDERRRELGTGESDKGRAVAIHVLAQAHSDQFTRAFAGQAPQGTHVWRSLVNPPAPPAYPAIGGMRTFLLESGDVLRSAPPPAMDSARVQNDLAEVKRHTEAPMAESTRLAKFYDMTSGTLAAGFWNSQAVERIRTNNLSDLQAARVLETMNTAMMDAVVACHDDMLARWTQTLLAQGTQP